MLYLILKYKRFIKFCIVGGIGALIDLGILIFLVEIFAIPVLLANVISFTLAVMNNFILNKIWTFNCKSKQYLKQFTQFLLISLIGLLINIILMHFLILLGFYYILAKIIIIVIISLWNFFANKYWTFKLRHTTNKQ